MTNSIDMTNAEIIPRTMVEMVADIAGPDSASFAALSEADHRITNGEKNIGFFQIGETIIVGPVPE